MMTSIYFYFKNFFVYLKFVLCQLASESFGISLINMIVVMVYVIVFWINYLFGVIILIRVRDTRQGDCILLARDMFCFKQKHQLIVTYIPIPIKWLAWRLNIYKEVFCR